MIVDLPPPLWLPPKPAIIRAARIERAPLPIEANIAPGWTPFIGVGALTTLSFVTSASSTGSTITIPVGARAGDLAALFDLAGSTGGPTAVTPSGWNLPSGNSNTTVAAVSRAMTHWKILDGGDPGATITGMNAASGNNKIMLVFRGNVPITIVTASSWNGQGSSGNPSAQSVTVSAQPVPLVVVGFAGCDGGTAAFSTASPAFDGTALNSDSDVIGGYKIYNSSPANHSIDMDDLGFGNHLHSGYLLCS